MNNSQITEAIQNGAFLVDVRTAEEFAGGSAEGAVNIPLDQVPTNLDKFEGKDSIVVFCRSGNRSGQAQMFLQHNGFSNVFNGGTWEDVAFIVEKTK